MKKLNLRGFEIVSYVVAVLFVIVAIFQVISNIQAMNEYLAAYGVTFMALGGQAIQTLVTAAGPYLVYAFFAVGIGKIYHEVAAPKCECDCECECDCDCEEEAVEEVLELEAPVEALEAPVEEVEEAEAEEEPVAVVWAETPEAVVVGEVAEEANEEEK